MNKFSFMTFTTLMLSSLAGAGDLIFHVENTTDRNASLAVKIYGEGINVLERNEDVQAGQTKEVSFSVGEIDSVPVPGGRQHRSWTASIGNPVEWVNREAGSSIHYDLHAADRHVQIKLVLAPGGEYRVIWG